MSTSFAHPISHTPALRWFLDRFALYLAAAVLSAQLFVGIAGYGRGGEWIVGAAAGEIFIGLWVVRRLRRLGDRLQLARTAHRVRALTEDATAGLAAVGLSKRIKAQTILSDVSVGVRRRETVALLGPNGAGKTTCLRCMVGDLRPDAGRVLLNGNDVTATPMDERRWSGVVHVPQSSSLLPLTVADNIMAALTFVEAEPALRRERLDELLSEFGLEPLRSTPAYALTAGERRRVEFLRALALRPDYLLLDEPFTGVDPIAQTALCDLIAGFKERGIGVLIAEHNAEAILGVVDRVYVLTGGRILATGTPESLLASGVLKLAMSA